MSGMLHPVGPETPGTYWARRVLVLGAATVLAVAVVLIIGGTSSGSAAQPRPPTAEYSVPDPASTSPAFSNPTSATPNVAATPTPSFVDLSASATATTETPKLKASSTKTDHSRPVDCLADELRATLTGKQRLAPRQRAIFQLSLINGSDQTCIAQVTAKNFELKITSGSKHIWSTDDCPSDIKPISRKLGVEHAVAWSLTWNGKRSKPDCRSAREAPPPGTYTATAQLDGADPVKLRMILKKVG